MPETPRCGCGQPSGPPGYGQPKTSPTLGAAHAAMLAAVKKRGGRPGTIEAYSNAMRLWLAPFASRPLASISREEARQFHAAITERSGKGAANAACTCACITWNFAKEELDPNLPPSNPFRGKNLLHKLEPRRRGMAPSDLPAWHAARFALPNRIRAEACLALLLSGARTNDIVSLEWSAIDWAAGNVRFDCPKGGEARAYSIPMSRALTKCFRRAGYHGRRLHHAQAARWVFPSATGHLNDARAPSLGCSGHGLRSTFVGFAALVGLHEWVIGRLINHSPTRSVTQSYLSAGALDDRALRDAMEKVAAFVLARRRKT
jgi:integrase